MAGVAWTTDMAPYLRVWWWAPGDKLLEDAERLHREYLEIVKSRAPEDDPRIQELGIDEPAADSA
ncbi:MAG: hypothetical protein ACT4PO_05050 [Actinomycetota bacterium]